MQGVRHVDPLTANALRLKLDPDEIQKMERSQMDTPYQYQKAQSSMIWIRQTCLRGGFLLSIFSVTTRRHSVDKNN